LQARWEALSDDRRQEIEQRVRQRLGGAAPAAFVRRLCLLEAGALEGEGRTSS
jgi:hypothetical protein